MSYVLVCGFVRNEFRNAKMMTEMGLVSTLLHHLQDADQKEKSKKDICDTLALLFRCCLNEKDLRCVCVCVCVCVCACMHVCTCACVWCVCSCTCACAVYGVVCVCVLVCTHVMFMCNSEYHTYATWHNIV